MPSAEEFFKKPHVFTLLVVGYRGTGKTRLALQFPRCYSICADPGGIDILNDPANARLKKNLVFYEYVYNTSKEYLERFFGRQEVRTIEEIDALCETPISERADEFPTLDEQLAHLEWYASQGKINTILFDGFTYFTQMAKSYLWEFEIRKTGGGNIDTRAMYGDLSMLLLRLNSKLMKLVGRYNVNLIVTSHIKRESEDEIKGIVKHNKGGPDDKKAKHILLSTDIAPDIEGSTREKIQGQFGTVMYLINECDTRDNVSRYAISGMVYMKSMETVICGKDRYGLPAKMEISNKSVYSTLINLASGKIIVVDGVIQRTDNVKTNNTENEGE